jgi:DNA-binding SARP family transcriptional activator
VVSASRTVPQAAPFADEAATDARLHLLGGFDLRVDEMSVRVAVNGQRLLAFLALHERPVERQYVAAKLWMDASEERAGGNLRTTLWRLRRVSRPIVEARSNLLRLSPQVSVDIQEFIGLSRRLTADPSPSSLERCASLCLIGDLLPDWYDEWVVADRERIRQLRLHALDVICASLASAGRFTQALEAGLVAVAAEPLRESAQRAVIAVHLAEGNLMEAIRQYDSYRTTLRRELGAEPSRMVTELFEPHGPVLLTDVLHPRGSVDSTGIGPRRTVPDTSRGMGRS